ncbi:MAG: hypothetical protein WCA89_04260, partial [Terracidiphilus sp.]
GFGQGIHSMGVHSKVPPTLFSPEFAHPAGIIETALGAFVRSIGSLAAAFQSGHRDGALLP